MYQNRVIEVSGVFSGCAGWNARGMYARYVHMDARVGRGLGQSPRQISSLTGKKRGSRVNVPTRGRRRARRRARARASSLSRWCVPATAGRSRRVWCDERAREVWITRAPPRDTRKGGKSRRTAESTFRGSGVSKRFRQRLAQSKRLGRIRNFTRASNPILIDDCGSVCKKWKRRPNLAVHNGGSGTSNEGALGFRDFPAVNRRWLQTTVYFPELISHLDNSSNPPGKYPGRSVANPRVNIGSTASSVQSVIITESHNTVPTTMMGRYRAC